MDYRPLGRTGVRISPIHCSGQGPHRDCGRATPRLAGCRAHGDRGRDLMLRSDPRRVEAVFDHLEQRHGSTERFLTACGVTPISLARVRERLLED